MAATEEKIAIHCVFTQENFDGFSQVIAKFQHGLKEDIELRHIGEDPGPDFVKNEGIYVVDRKELIPDYNFYYYKRCRLYYYTSDMADTEEWIRNALLDGIVLESSDTTVRTFLEDCIDHEYRRQEDRYIKSVEEWLSLSGLPRDNQMLTVSFGKMRRIYNELKKFVEYEQLREKYRKPRSLEAYRRFIDMLYQADSLTDTTERMDELTSAVTGMEKEEEKLRKSGVQTASILLTGETGVGKSLLAEYFQHYLLDYAGTETDGEKKSARNSGSNDRLKPDKLNCSQLAREQVRTELFGALKGTYTDQTRTIPGRILENTLRVFVLDEIADMDPSLQPQLLSYLDDSRVQPQHMDRAVFAPLIFVATTNRDIPSLISQGLFRKDLYERFDLHLHLPPIRERREEIKPFIKTMLGRERANRPRIFKELFISKALIEHLKAFDFGEGNFRELQRVVRQAVRNCISRGERIIKREHLGE